ncbi:MAG: hypothetical protein QOF55_344 [Thermoleophilaceae bacterium]|nr:hypothetical protein [Thermoleophilaceae bacterium]
MTQATVTLPPRRAEPSDPIRLDRLAECVRRLDPATRALLDLSVRRGVRDDQMAPILRTDPFHLAWRRARALEQVAGEIGTAERPAPLGEVRMALEALPREAWGLPGMGPPALPAPEPTAAGKELVPAPSAEIAGPAGRPGGRIARLDAFASESPTLRAALRDLGRAVAAKAVLAVIWRRRG